MELSWQITYPNKMVKYVDFFRNELFQYHIYDEVVRKYICKYSDIEVRHICSLGCGSGRHEAELKRMGYEITGIERNSESHPLACAVFQEKEIEPIPIILADFFDFNSLKLKLKQQKFDCIVLLFVPLSIPDTLKLVDTFEYFLKPGGIFISNQFMGYPDGFTPNVLLTDNDYAENPLQKNLPFSDREYCFRHNIYRYNDHIVEWIAIYIYTDENGNVKMSRDHDIIDVLIKTNYKERLIPQNINMELLPIYEVHEIDNKANIPQLTDCIVAWKKKILN